MTALLVLAVLLVAYVNGANDSFKGVATLFGSGTASYRTALGWATLTTFAGSVMSLGTGAALVRSFSGRGLVPEALTGDLHFLAAVGGGAALTVLLATLGGLPISTTHALVGGLMGAGMVAARSQVNPNALGKNFLYPLLLSPFLSILLTVALYLPFRAVRRILGVEEETCLCVGDRQELVDIRSDGTGILRSTGVTLAVGEMSRCRPRYSGSVLGVSAQQGLELLHFLSAGAVGFARGLNDTPKVVALLVAANLLGLQRGWVLAVTALMAAGGLLSARRVGETMSHRITGMNEGQGFSANLATALLVIPASLWGLPVSTTHVSVGALFGLGLVNRRADGRQVLSILGAWVTTLPLAAFLAAVLYLAATRIA